MERSGRIDRILVGPPRSFLPAPPGYGVLWTLPEQNRIQQALLTAPEGLQAELSCYLRKESLLMGKVK